MKRHLDHWVLQPQMFWLLDSRGKVGVDFVGRFETLERDFRHVCDVLGIEDDSLPRLISGDGLDYTQHYDGETREAVARKYAEEIELFGFRFGE
jgi:hypothetical protein